MKKYFLSLLLLGCAACNSSSNTVPFSYSSIKDPNSLRIILDRDMCFGTCPSYVVEIAGDGSVTYCGDDVVEEIGIRKRKISTQEVRALFSKVIAADFFNQPDEYFANVTDMPRYIIQVSYDDKAKTIIDYAGTYIDMPASITDLEDSIDLASQTKKWIGDKGKYEYKPDGPRCANRLAFRITDFDEQ